MDEVARVREKTNVVELVSEFVALKRAGSNFKGLCPFHSEKSPSFVVSPERQIWHCFGGCGKGGDVFSFLMEYENMDFPEALKILARRAGIELADRGFDTGVSSKKDKIYKINKITSEYYNYVLTKHKAGKEALSYLLKERGLNDGIISTFLLGFSPKGGDDLVHYLQAKKKYKTEDLEEAGLLTRARGKDLDFFRGRIMFPLTDNRGNIVGFSGRALKPDVSPKYINTKETVAYHKGNLFFGLDKAIPEIKKKDKVIITEGELDVIACYMNGIKNVVAIKGTALTEEQATLIARYTLNISLCLDRDPAGLEAIKRSLVTLEKNGLTTTVVVLSTGKDADEAIKNDLIGFKKSVVHDLPVYDFLLSSFVSASDKGSVLGKKKISDSMLPFIVNIENEIVKEHALKKLSEELDTTYESIVRQMDKIQRPDNKASREGTTSPIKKNRKETLEEYLFALVVQSEDARDNFQKVKEILGDYEFEAPAYGKIYEKIKDFIQRGQDFKNVGKSISPELLPTFDKWFLFPLPEFAEKGKYQEEVASVARELKTLHLKKKMQNLTDKLRNTGHTSEEEKLREELNHIIELLSPSTP